MKLLNHEINIPDFFMRVRRGALLMLDYDGTLAPFVKERMQAFPYPDVKERLLALKNLKTTRTIIVSGRSLLDLETLLEIPDLELWGSHGLERKLSTEKTIYTEINAKLSNALKSAIEICHENLDSEHIEIKPYAVAVHTRGISQSGLLRIELVEKLWKKICLNNALEIHSFDGGLELRPKMWNKGNVIQQLLTEVPINTAIAYLGDDATDEQAFASLGNKGLKVLVRAHFRPTLADLYLIPPQELLKFLDQWIGEI
jgi:trehalose 6-phosphate phosphatase